jgi:hypothetical protein
VSGAVIHWEVSKLGEEEMSKLHSGVSICGKPHLLTRVTAA